MVKKFWMKFFEVFEMAGALCFKDGFLFLRRRSSYEVKSKVLKELKGFKTQTQILNEKTIAK